MRYYGLDFARSFFMLFGIVLHSALIYQSGGNWRVSYSEQSDLFNYIGYFSKNFRMEGFYIIAGFFFTLLVEKYGVLKSFKDRLIKVSIPLIFVGMTFNTLMNLFSENWVFSDTIRYVIDGEWLGHLWFIGNLIFYYLLTIGIAPYFTQGRRNKHSYIKIIFISFVLVPLSSTALYIIGKTLHPDSFLFLSFAELYYHFPLFCLGMYFWSQKDKIFTQLSLFKGLILVCLFGCCVLALELLELEQVNWHLFFIVKTLSRVCLALAIIILLNQLGNKPSKLIRNICDSSYSIYLLHQPLIIIIFALVLKPTEINLFISFLLLCSVVFFLSFSFHFFLIKKNRYLLFLFNGKWTNTNNDKEKNAWSGESFYKKLLNKI